MTSSGFVEDRAGYIIVGESIVFSHKWLEATTVATVSSKVYFKKTDVTSVVMPAGSNSVSGTIQTCPALVANAAHAGGNYVIEFKATVDGNIEIRKYQLACIATGKEL